MGGSRCVFRDCQVSAYRNPKMHFFKFPIRDPVRLKAWLINCGNTEILNVPREKLTNQAVCARHFRYECFMNYKLDRLIPNQVPTLIRVSKESAWDLANLDDNGEPSMVQLTPTLAHLIPPSGFECPLGYSADDRFFRKFARRRTSKPLPLEEASNKKQRLQEVEIISPVVDLTKTKGNQRIINKMTELEQLDKRGSIKCIPESYYSTAIYSVQPAPPAQKCLNKLEDRSIDMNGRCKQIEEKKSQLEQMDETKVELKQLAKRVYPQSKDSTVLEVDPVEPGYPASEYLDKLINLTNSQESLAAAVDPVKPSPPANNKLDELQFQYNELKVNLERISLENTELKQTVGQLETKLTQARKTPSLTASRCTPAPSLSKPQLYRGIQKYLGPTMAALVRMEMFGGGERAWKEDERDFAKELLQLGEHVYSHCCDEWRFRLPTLRQAKSWLDEGEIAKNEDDDL